MSKLQLLLEMRQRDNEICHNLAAVKGTKYAESVSAFANLVSMTELAGKMIPELREPISMITCDSCQTVARLLGADFKAFMLDVVMVAHSRVAGASAIAKNQGGDRG